MSSEDVPNKRKRSPAFIVVPLLMLILATTFVLLNSNLALSKAEVIFTEVKDRNLNKMTIRAPYGAYVQTFSVVPGWSAEKPFREGGRSLGGEPYGLFFQAEIMSNTIPGEGRVTDIDYGAPVLMTKSLSIAAVGAWPKDKTVLESCGRYIWMSKKPKTKADLDAFLAKLNKEFLAAKSKNAKDTKNVKSGK